MKQATKRFLKIRGTAQHINRVEYRPHSQAKQNQCYLNSVAEYKRTGNDIVAGWVVGDYNKEHDQTPIIFHFWNCDADGNHYDTTPEPELAHVLPNNWEYVMDSAVFFESKKWCKDNQIDHMYFPPSIKMRSTGIEIATREQGNGFGWSPQPEQPFSIYDLFELRSKFQKAFAFDEA